MVIFMNNYRIIIRNIIFIFLILLVSIESLIAQDIDSTKIIRVLTYNIFHGETMNHDFNLDLIANVIKSLNPDIVALQEVDYKTKRVGGRDLITELGYLTNMLPLFGKAMDYNGGEYGEGILSRYSFKETKNNTLPHSPNNEPRSALEVSIELPSGFEIIFIGTHLDHTENETDRIKQVIKINELFADNKIPTILAGDLNAIPESKSIKILKEHWIDASSEDPHPTWPSSNPKEKLDYVMFLPPECFRIIETKVIDEKLASDHCPLLVILELLPKKNNINQILNLF